MRSDGVLDGRAVSILVIVELGPQHDSSVVGGVLERGKHLRLEAPYWCEPTPCSIWCSRQAKKDVLSCDPCCPLVPGIDEVGLIYIVDHLDIDLSITTLYMG